MSEKERKWERAKRVVIAAQGLPVLFSGGAEKTDNDVIENAQACSDAGCFGFICGRNIWKREYANALEITEKFKKILDGQSI